MWATPHSPKHYPPKQIRLRGSRPSYSRISVINSFDADALGGMPTVPQSGASSAAPRSTTDGYFPWLNVPRAEQLERAATSFRSAVFRTKKEHPIRRARQG